MTELVTGKALPNVVVTGITMTTALATDAETTLKLLLDNQSGIRTLDDPFVEEFDLPVRIGGHLLEEFDHQLTRVELRRMGYLQKMSTILSRRLWENAGTPEIDLGALAVVHVEQLGSQTIAYGRLADGQPLTVVLEGQGRIATGDTLPVGVMAKDCHLFGSDELHVNS